MFLLSLLACPPEKDTGPRPEDTGYAYVDTSPVVETGDSQRTESVPDSDTDPVETGDDTAPPAPTLAALDAYPATILVNPDATFRARAVGTDADGVRADVTPTWTSDNEDVAAVDADGHVLALEAGTATLTAGYDGLEATVVVTVDDAWLARVTVLDATTGLPVPDARVALPSTSGERTDTSGVAWLPVPDGLPIDFSVWVDDTWDAITFLQVVNRSFTVALAPKAAEEADARLHGTVDFGAVDDAAWDEVVIGLTAPTVQGNLATLSLDDWFSDPRTLTVFGVDADLPSNLVVEGTADDYYVDARPGAVGSWMLAGQLKISDVSGATGSTGAALQVLVDHLDAMRWGWAGGATAVGGTQVELGLAPSARFDQSTVVAVPDLPAGFTGAEDVLVMTAEGRVAEGYVVTGFGMAVGDAVAVARVDAADVEDSPGTAVVAYAQAGGLGGTGGTSVSSGRVDALGNGDVAPWLDLPVITAWDPSARTLAVDVDDDADFVHVLLTDNHRLRHHLYVGGDWSGTLPNTIAGFGRAQSSLDVWTVATEDGTFEARAGAGDLDVHTFDARGAAHTRQE